MACPDRLKDKRIIAEIERRKQLVAASEQHNSNNNELRATIEWHGELLDVQFHVPDLNKIILIKRIDESRYLAQVMD